MKQTIKPIGQEINTLGKVINNKELMLVHLHLKSGEQIPSHDHKGQEVFFTIVAGTVEVALDDTEIHRISTGTVLHFPGEARVGVNAIEESDFSFTSSTDNNVMDMKKHLPSADLEKLGKILEIKEAYQRGDISLEEGRTRIREQIGEIRPYEIALAEQELKTIEENECRKEDIQK